MEENHIVADRMIVIGRSKRETSTCTRMLIPGISSNDNGDFELHRIPVKQICVNFDQTQKMQELKQYYRQSSAESSMSVESTECLPDYEHSDNDGGADMAVATGVFPRHRRDTEETCRKHALESEHQEHNIKKLKYGVTRSSFCQQPDILGFGGPRLAECSAGTSTSTTSSATTEAEDIRLSVCEIPWQTKFAGALMHLFVNTATVFILVLDVDEISNSTCVPEDYIKMVESLESYCGHRVQQKNPAMVVVGLSQNTNSHHTNDVRNKFAKSIGMFREAIVDHLFESRFVDGNFLLNDASSVNSLQDKLFKEIIPRVCISLNYSPTNVVQMNRLLWKIQKDGFPFIPTDSFVNDLKIIPGSFEKNDVEQYLENKESMLDLIRVKDDTGTCLCIKLEIVIQSYITLCSKIRDLTICGRDLIQKLKYCHNVKDTKVILNMIAVLERIGLLVNLSDQNTALSQKTIYQSEFVVSVNFEDGEDLYPNEETIKGDFSISPALRLCFECEVPEYVFCSLVTYCIGHFHWKPAGAGDRKLLFKNTAAFGFQKSHRLVLSRDGSNINAVIVRYGDKSKPVLCPECDLIRSVVAESVKTSYRVALKIEHSSLFKYQIRCKEAKGHLHDADGWIDVEDLKENETGTYQCEKHVRYNHPHPVKSSDLLHVWFNEEAASGVENMDMSSSKMGVGLLDVQLRTDHTGEQLLTRILPKLAVCFGKYWDMFFIEQGLPENTIDQIKNDKRMGQIEQVYEALNEWTKQRKDKGLATISNLQRELKECKSVSINWDTFENVVQSKN